LEARRHWIREDRPEELARSPCGGQKRLAHLVVDQDCLDRSVAQCDELEPRRGAQLVETG
jgi:hypothetical protein